MDSNYSFEDADYLLKRDWFFSREDIEDLMWELNQNVFDKVLENRRSYSIRIQDVLHCYEPPLCKHAKDLTDEMMDEIWNEREDRHIQNAKDSLHNFVPPPREKTFWDIHFDKLTEQSKVLNNTYNKMIERPKYNKDRIDKIWYDMKTIENELNQLQEKIVSLDTDWKELQWIETVALASAKHRLQSNVDVSAFSV